MLPALEDIDRASATPYSVLTTYAVLTLRLAFIFSATAAERSLGYVPNILAISAPVLAFMAFDIPFEI